MVPAGRGRNHNIISQFPFHYIQPIWSTGSKQGISLCPPHPFCVGKILSAKVMGFEPVIG